MNFCRKNSLNWSEIFNALLSRFFLPFFHFWIFVLNSCLIFVAKICQIEVRFSMPCFHDFFRLFSRSNFHSKSVSRTCWDTWYVIIKNSGIEKTFLVSHPPCSSKSQKWYPIIHVVFFVQINLICFIIWFRRRFHRNSCKWPLDHLGSKRIAGGDLIPNAYFYAFWIFPHVLVWLDSLKKRAAVLPLLMMMAFSAIRDDEEAMHFVLFFALVID